MIIRIFRDLKQYTLTSSITKDDIDIIKKYRPAALKKKDADGNDIFAVSYVEDRPCISPSGMTFGSVSAEGGYVMIVGSLPETLPEHMSAGDYVADKVGSALSFVSEFETSVPDVANSIRHERAELINGIVEV